MIHSGGLYRFQKADKVGALPSLCYVGIHPTGSSSGTDVCQDSRTDDQPVILIYAYVTYILYGMMYTGVNIPYGSLASVMTDDPMERSSLSVWRSVGAGFGNIPSMILLPLLVYSTVIGADGTETKVLDPTKLGFAVLCIAVVSIGIYSLHFRNVKERITVPPKQKQEGMHVFRTVGIFLRTRRSFFYVWYPCF